MPRSNLTKIDWAGIVTALIMGIAALINQSNKADVETVKTAYERIAPVVNRLSDTVEGLQCKVYGVCFKGASQELEPEPQSIMLSPDAGCAPGSGMGSGVGTGSAAAQSTPAPPLPAPPEAPAVIQQMPRLPHFEELFE